jgi:hypothetical protein
MTMHLPRWRFRERLSPQLTPTPLSASMNRCYWLARSALSLHGEEAKWFCRNNNGATCLCATGSRIHYTHHDSGAQEASVVDRDACSVTLTRSRVNAAMPLEYAVARQQSRALGGSSSCSWHVYPLPLVYALMGATIDDGSWRKRHACLLWIGHHSQQPGRTFRTALSSGARAFMSRTLAPTGSVGG